MAREVDVVIERDADSYLVASVPALPGCHSQARSLDELMNRIREAIEVNPRRQGKTTNRSTSSQSSVFPWQHDAAAQGRGQ